MALLLKKCYFGEKGAEEARENSREGGRSTRLLEFVPSICPRVSIQVSRLSLNWCCSVPIFFFCGVVEFVEGETRGGDSGCFLLPKSL